MMDSLLAVEVKRLPSKQVSHYSKQIAVYCLLVVNGDLRYHRKLKYHRFFVKRRKIKKKKKTFCKKEGKIIETEIQLKIQGLILM